MAYKIYVKSNYFYVVDTDTEKILEALAKDVRVRKEFVDSVDFYFDNVNGLPNTTKINIEDIQDEQGNPYADLATFVAFYEANTGNFNLGGATPQLTTDELNAVQGANSPSDTNVFATMADVGGGGGVPDAPNNANAYVRSALSWVIGYTKTAIDTLLGTKKNVVNGIIASGTDTYTATYTPILTAYTDGLEVLVRFTNANTTTATLNLNSLGAKSIVKGVSTSLVAGDIPANTTLLLSYDGTNFVIVGSQLVNQFFDFSPTYSGFSTPPSGGNNRYCVQDKICHFYMMPTINGTSNATTYTVTLPFVAKNLQVIPLNSTIDNGSIAIGGNANTTAGSNILTIGKFTGVWTASGAKRVVVQGFFEIQ